MNETTNLIGEFGENDGKPNLGVVLLEVRLESVRTDIVPVNSLVVELAKNGQPHTSEAKRIE